MKKLLALLTVLAFSTQTSFAAPAALANAQAMQRVGTQCSRIVSRKRCKGQIEFRDGVLKCNTCGALASSSEVSTTTETPAATTPTNSTNATTPTTEVPAS